MSRPSDKWRQPSVSDQPPAPARAADAGIARGPGLAVAGVTAAVVFAIGQQLFPVRPRQEPPPPAPVVVTPPPVAPSSRIRLRPKVWASLFLLLGLGVAGNFAWK